MGEKRRYDDAGTQTGAYLLDHSMDEEPADSLQAREPWPGMRTLHRFCKHVSSTLLIRVMNYENPLPISPFVCTTCYTLPERPVIGECGHTRCYRCVVDSSLCACGGPAPENINVMDIQVKDLIDQMFKEQLKATQAVDSAKALFNIGYSERALDHIRAALKFDPLNIPLRIVRAKIWMKRSQWSRAEDELSALKNINPRVAEVRFLLGKALWKRDAAKLAVMEFLVAVILGTPTEVVRRYIVEAIPIYLTGKPLTLEVSPSLYVSSTTAPDEHILYDCRVKRKLKKRVLGAIESELYVVLMDQSNSWDAGIEEPLSISPSALECVLCMGVYLRPVTTPCGHTYCRACIERSLDHCNACPLCHVPLGSFLKDDRFKDSAFVSAIVEKLPPPLRVREPVMPDMLPIFVCTAAFPYVSCPLFVFEPRYRLMLRRCLESGSRRFGIVAGILDPGHGGPRYADFGTVLEIKDCVKLSDGCSLVSTMGVSRFQVMERAELDGYDMARVEPVYDQPYMGNKIFRLLVIVRARADSWLASMSQEARDEIEGTFGKMPPFEVETIGVDGPAWVWWLLAILPLAVQLKVMILATEELVKRLRAIYRTFEYLEIAEKPNELHVAEALEYPNQRPGLWVPEPETLSEPERGIMIMDAALLTPEGDT